MQNIVLKGMGLNLQLRICVDCLRRFFAQVFFYMRTCHLWFVKWWILPLQWNNKQVKRILLLLLVFFSAPIRMNLVEINIRKRHWNWSEPYKSNYKTLWHILLHTSCKLWTEKRAKLPHQINKFILVFRQNNEWIEIRGKKIHAPEYLKFTANENIYFLTIIRFGLWIKVLSQWFSP